MKAAITLNGKAITENPIWDDAEQHMLKFRSDIEAQVTNESKRASLERQTELERQTALFLLGKIFPEDKAAD